MNRKQLACEPERIELFLRQQLTGEEQADFEAHLDGCDDCCRRLKESAASEDVWDSIRESLRAEQALPDADGWSGGQMDSASGEDRPAFSVDDVRQLLAPTDDDRMMGRLGGYEVVGIIGTGGMGVVVKALDPALNRYVAIKILSPHLGNSGAARKRFAREAQAAAAVVHDNVIEIHGVADAKGLPYLVMPYVRGPSLQKRLDDDGPLSVVEILRIARQAAAGLAAAHAQGLVHRDVKPANILLADRVERVKLTDFGLARAADDASLTKTGVIAGTPQFMSPEQARGEPVDPRSDLFGLGSVMYAMCTGRPPFRAETSYGILRRITDTEPRPIREINPDIPDWLCAIVAKLMSKQPEDRFESASDITKLLEECLAHVQQPTNVPLPWHKLAAGEPVRQAVGLSHGTPQLRCSTSQRLFALAAFAFTLLVAGVLIALELNKGTLTIESDADNVPIKITQGDKIVEKLTVTKEGDSIRVAAGSYVVEIEGAHDWLTVDNGTLTVTRGKTQIARIVQKPSQPDRSVPIAGLVVAVSNGLAEISAGADDGVRNSMRFHVFREPNILLGQIEIIKIDPNRSVGRIVQDDVHTPIQNGDRIVAAVPAAVPAEKKAQATVGETGQLRSPQVVTQIGPAGGGLDSGSSQQMMAQLLLRQPQQATVTFNAASDNETVLQIPGRLPVVTAQTLRGTLSRIPNRVGLELAMSVELPGVAPETRAFLEHNAIPLVITSEDIEQTVAGNLVTKVIYLPNSDNPDAALAGVETLVTTRLEPGVDPISSAHRRGVILAVVRLGNRGTLGVATSAGIVDYSLRKPNDTARGGAVDPASLQRTNALQELQGDWVFVSMERAGKTERMPSIKPFILTVDGDGWFIRLGPYNDPDVAGRISIDDASTTPKKLTLLTTDGPEKFTVNNCGLPKKASGIYEVGHYTLRLCIYDASSEKLPPAEPARRPSQFQSDEQRGWMVYTLKRVKPTAKDEKRATSEAAAPRDPTVTPEKGVVDSVEAPAGATEAADGRNATVDSLDRHSLDYATKQFNAMTADARSKLFDPPIADLKVDRLRE